MAKRFLLERALVSGNCCEATGAGFGRGYHQEYFGMCQFLQVFQLVQPPESFDACVSPPVHDRRGTA